MLMLGMFSLFLHSCMRPTASGGVLKSKVFLVDGAQT